MLQTASKSCYLPDDFKWDCNKGCLEGKHTIGCQKRRDALVKKYWKTRERIIRNRNKSRNALEEAISKVRFLTSRWCHFNEQLEIELRRYSDICFIEGIDVGDTPPDEYDPLDRYYEHADACQDRVEKLTTEIESLKERFKNVSQESFENRKKGWDANLRDAKYALQTSLSDVKFAVKGQKECSAPAEERENQDILAGIREPYANSGFIPTEYGESRSANRSRYDVQVSFNQPDLPHTLRYLSENMSEGMVRLREYDSWGKIPKIRGISKMNHLY